MSACLQCGKETHPKTRAPKLYCDAPCRMEAHNTRLGADPNRIVQRRPWRKKRAKIPCARCGVMFIPHGGSNARWAGKYHDGTCRLAALHETLRQRGAVQRAKTRAAEDLARQEWIRQRVKWCPMCGAEFQAGNITQSTCGKVECVEQYRKAYSRETYFSKSPFVHHTVCRQCGTPLPRVPLGVMGRPSPFCGEACRKKAAEPGRKKMHRKAKAARRARKRALPYERFDPLDVFERDAWTCQLCGVHTPRRLRGSCDDRAPELDHIVPLAKGGAHTRVNTQCLCRKCNYTKGTEVRGQLRLCG